jgi:hypothetical protein
MFFFALRLVVDLSGVLVARVPVRFKIEPVLPQGFLARSGVFVFKVE